MWKGIAITGIWLGSALAMYFTNSPGIFIGSTIATVAIALS